MNGSSCRVRLDGERTEFSTLFRTARPSRDGMPRRRRRTIVLSFNFVVVSPFGFSCCFFCAKNTFCRYQVSTHKIKSVSDFMRMLERGNFCCANRKKEFQVTPGPELSVSSLEMDFWFKFIILVLQDISEDQKVNFSNFDFSKPWETFSTKLLQQQKILCSSLHSKVIRFNGYI